MLTAHDINGNKILPIKLIKAYCPFCKQEVISCFSKLGKNDYWRHKVDNENKCLAYKYKNQGLWHNKTKLLWGIDFTEIYISKDSIKRRADVMLKNGLVIEVQNSSIDSVEIRSREYFYGKMVWLFNATDAYSNYRIDFQNNLYYWTSPRESIKMCTVPVFIAISDKEIIQIKTIEQYYEYEETWHSYRKLFFKGKYERMTFEEFKNKMIFTDINFKDISYPINWKKEFNNQIETIQLELF